MIRLFIDRLIIVIVGRNGKAKQALEKPATVPIDGMQQTIWISMQIKHENNEFQTIIMMPNKYFPDSYKFLLLFLIDAMF